MRKAISVEQFIIIGDGGDNTNPKFAATYDEYCKLVAAKPNVTLLHIPGDTNRLGPEMKAAGVDYQEIEFRGDYYSLPDMLTIMSRNTIFDLVAEIMEIELPKRSAA